MVDNKSGFSLWVDFIERDFIGTKLKNMADYGIIDGATSNPSIFANAITKSTAYKEQLQKLEGKNPKDKYEALAIADIKAAAKVLRPSYDKGLEGYVSIEVDPFLANNTEATIAEGIRLFKKIDEPNIMTKVPATDAGYLAMTALMSRGISVNATLIFSPKQAENTMEAMQVGMKDFQQFDEGRVEGVISIFVSRFDRMLDSKLQKLGIPTAKTGILNAAKIYNKIAKCKTPSIKALFASTGVKPEQGLPQDYYITSLCAKNSINTAPIETIEVYEKNPNKEKLALPIETQIIYDHFKALEKAGIDIQKVYDTLMEDGLKTFKDAFTKLLKAIG